MRYRTLGNTGIEVSVIGFGCGGNARLMVEDDDALRLATIGSALDNGINYFDTASAYGDGLSERNLGRALKELDAHPVISTKIVLQDEDLSDPRSAVLRKFDEGLHRLDLEGVDALLLHNRVFLQPTAGRHAVGSQLSLDHIFASNGVAAGFQDILESGQVKTVGFTSYGSDVKATDELIQSKVFGVLNASINLLNPSSVVDVSNEFPEPNYGDASSRASEAGMGVMAIQVLARGVLTGSGPTDGRSSEIAAAALAFDSDLPSVATRYVLSKPAVSTAILGLSEPAHVSAAVRAEGKGPLSPDQVASLEQFAQTDARND